MSQGGSPPSWMKNALVAYYDPYRQYVTTGASQTLLDYSGRGNHGTLGASTSAGADDPSFTGTALSFDGVDDFVGLPTITAPSDAGVTAIAVVKKTNTAANQTIATSGGYYRWYFANDNTTIQFRYRLTDTSYATASLGLLGTRTQDWNVLMWAANSTTDILVSGINGTYASISHAGGIYSNNTVTPVIAYDSSFGYLTGKLAFFGFWKTLFSAGTYARAYTYLKSLMASRGVTVA